MSEDKKNYGYRLPVRIRNKELEQYLKEMSWRNRQTVTEFVTDILMRDMEAYFAAGGTKEGWLDVE